ncbi:hypothetical protein ES703_85287 [subsurface metagenome]
MPCQISVRDIDFHASTEGVRIRAWTDTPSHLFVRLSRKRPWIHKKPSLRRGVAFAEDVRFCFTVFEDNEQEESGDTLEHTWWKKDWPVCTTKWLYVWGMRSGETCLSTTAPFKYHNDGVDPIEPPPPPEPELFEYWHGPFPGAWTVRSGFHIAQTFTPQTSHELTKVVLRLYRNGSDPTEIFYCAIRNTVAGKPSGGNLGLSSFPMNDLPLLPGEIWKDIPFTPNIPLNTGEMYAIVCWTNDDLHPFILWRNDTAAGTYPRGTMCFTYNGVTWTLFAPGDSGFQEWGFPT